MSSAEQPGHLQEGCRQVWGAGGKQCVDLSRRLDTVNGLCTWQLQPGMTPHSSTLAELHLSCRHPLHHPCAWHVFLQCHSFRFWQLVPPVGCHTGCNCSPGLIEQVVPNDGRVILISNSSQCVDAGRDGPDVLLQQLQRLGAPAHACRTKCRKQCKSNAQRLTPGRQAGGWAGGQASRQAACPTVPNSLLCPPQHAGTVLARCMPVSRPESIPASWLQSSDCARYPAALTCRHLLWSCHQHCLQPKPTSFLAPGTLQPTSIMCAGSGPNSQQGSGHSSCVQVKPGYVPMLSAKKGVGLTGVQCQRQLDDC